MAFDDVIRRLGSLGKKAGNAGASAGASVADKFGIKHHLGCPIGIDFGIGSLKVLQVNPTEPPGLVAAACVETPEELIRDHAKRLDFQIEALARIVRKTGFRGKRAVCSIPATATVCRQLQFPKTEGVAVSSLVAGALAQQLGCPAESIVFRHFELQSAVASTGKADVLCLAVSREWVQKLMKGLISAKLEPVGMHTEFVGVVRAFDYVNRRASDTERTTLYLDIGSGGTKLMITHGKDLVFARSLEFGGRVMDEYLCKQLKVDMAEARRQRLALDTRLAVEAAQKASEAQANASALAVPQNAAQNTGQSAAPGATQAQSGGADSSGSTPVATATAGEEKPATDVGAFKFTGDGARTERRAGEVAPGFSPDVTVLPRGEFHPPQADLSEPMETLTDEVQMCLRYHGTQFPGRKVEKVVFVGGEARLRGLCQAIARSLRIPAQMADPMARVGRGGQEPMVGVDLKIPQPGWALALGLCLSPTDL